MSQHHTIIRHTQGFMRDSLRLSGGFCWPTIIPKPHHRGEPFIAAPLPPPTHHHLSPQLLLSHRAFQPNTIHRARACARSFELCTRASNSPRACGTNNRAARPPRPPARCGSSKFVTYIVHNMRADTDFIRVCTPGAETLECHLRASRGGSANHSRREHSDAHRDVCCVCLRACVCVFCCVLVLPLPLLLCLVCRRLVLKRMRNVSTAKEKRNARCGKVVCFRCVSGGVIVNPQPFQSERNQSIARARSTKTPSRGGRGEGRAEVMASCRRRATNLYIHVLYISYATCRHCLLKSFTR